jgi:hypothetical protein
MDEQQDDRPPAATEARDALIESGYPRPQLARQNWTDLSGQWDFASDDADVGLGAGWQTGDGPFGQAITVPYPPESPLSGVGDRGFHPVVWYRRQFEVPARPVGERVLLHFGAVDYAARVWVNGRLAGRHEGGHTPFSFDITDLLVPAGPAGPDGPADLLGPAGPAGPDGPAVLVVRAADDPADPYQPRGKQDWRQDPHGIWYHRTTGIWQPVWLETVPRCHVTALCWQADIAASRVSAEVELSRAAAPGSTLRLRLAFGDEVLAEQTAAVTGRHVRLHLAVPALDNAWDRGRLLWAPEAPRLIDAELELAGPDDAQSDRVSSYLGLRTIEVTDGHFLMNGRPRFLRFALEQGYWPQSHLAAPSPQALRDEVKLARSLGLNGVRLHQKAEDPRFLYWADRHGLMVWDEMPSPAGFSAQAIPRLTAEWQEILLRDRSHPCVVAWVPVNESWGVPDIAGQPAQRDLAAALYHLTRSIDPTRPVISNDGWQQLDGDIWTVHDYAPSGRGLTERYGSREAVAATLAARWPGPHRVVFDGAPDRGQPVMLTEFGGVTCTADADPDGTWHGYGSVAKTADLVGRLADLVGAVCSSDVVTGFCYTQLTDTEQERNGLVYADRTPKVKPAQLRAIFGQPSRAVPGEELAAAKRKEAAARKREAAERQEEAQQEHQTGRRSLPIRRSPARRSQGPKAHA